MQRSGEQKGGGAVLADLAAEVFLRALRVAVEPEPALAAVGRGMCRADGRSEDAGEVPSVDLDAVEDLLRTFAPAEIAGWTSVIRCPLAGVFAWGGWGRRGKGDLSPPLLGRPLFVGVLLV
ncbi:hypothetical protein ASF71_21375 [Deinococcus sp. Leaf326]|nr:hypothetical protein ASF71_21375 [Deinococcus sp. Leaf326]